MPHVSRASRNGRSIRSGLRCFLTLLVVWTAAPAAGQDLTGIWRDNNGGRYVVRQAGDEFCWSSEPNNVFCGTVIENVIAGSWLDLPTGRFRGSGRMVLRVESSDRLVKVHQTANYGASVWTREGSATSTQAGSSSTAGGSGAGGDSNPADNTINGGPTTWDYRSVGDSYKTGDKVRFVCPPAQPMRWRALSGTNLYTGDSVVCQAAVYQGLMTWAGGTVVVEVMPGASNYVGGEQNGVLSNSWNQTWPSSFRFVSGPGAGTSSADMDRGDPPIRNAGGSGADTSRAGMVDAGRTDWASVVAVDLRSRPVGTRIQYTCPPGGQFYGYVWGTDVYTGDTLPCAAAVHAGVITFAAGGDITVEIRPGQTAYHGSERNGVSSKSFGPYTSSFAIVE